MFLDILIGVLSGVITSAIIWIVAKIFNLVIIPWYQVKIYRGLDIEGTWKAKEEFEGNQYEYTIEINQTGHKISGKYIARNIFDDEESYSYYEVTGIIRDNYVSIQYITSNNKQIGLGSFLLKIADGGDSLIGPLIYLDKSETGVHASPDNINFKREK